VPTDWDGHRNPINVNTYVVVDRCFRLSACTAGATDLRGVLFNGYLGCIGGVRCIIYGVFLSEYDNPTMLVPRAECAWNRMKKHL